MNLLATHQLQQATQDLISAIEAGGPGSGRHPGPGVAVAKHLTDNGFKKTSSAKWNIAGPQPNYKHPDGHMAHVGQRGDWTVQSNTGRMRMGNPGTNAGLALGHLRDLGIAPAKAVKACTLKEGDSGKTIGENIARQRKAGVPEDQAVAIAYSKAKKE